MYVELKPIEAFGELMSIGVDAGFVKPIVDSFDRVMATLSQSYE